MKIIHSTAALATSIAVLAYATMSRADTTKSTTTTTAAPYVVMPSGGESVSRTEHRPNGALLSTGISLFVVSYVPSVFAAALSERDEDKNLYIPLVGPWIDLAKRDCTARPCGNNEEVSKAMIVTAGVVEGAGVLLGLASLVIPETTETTRVAATKPTVRIAPVSFGAGGGLGAIGRF